MTVHLPDDPARDGVLAARASLWINPLLQLGTIDAALHIPRQFLGIHAAQKRCVKVLPFASDLGSPRAEI